MSDTMIEFVLVDSDGNEIARELARTKGKALLVLGKRADVNSRLEFCGPDEANLRLRWLRPITKFPIELPIDYEWDYVRYSGGD
jgi:hypothetical protein